MTKRIGGGRRKTRDLYSKPLRMRGKFNIKSFFQKFSEGDKVIFKAEPAHQGGMYHRRFHGRVGVVKGSQGECYKVAISDGSIKKTLLVHPVHLKKIELNA